MHITTLVVVQSWDSDPSIWTYTLGHSHPLTFQEVGKLFREGLRAFRADTWKRRILPNGWEYDQYGQEMDLNFSETVGGVYPWFTIIDAIEEQPDLFRQHLEAQGLSLQEAVSVVFDNDDFSDDYKGA